MSERGETTGAGAAGQRRARSPHSLLADGAPMTWMTGGALVVSLAMIIGLVGLVIVQGGATFWPKALVQVRLHDGRVFMGEVTRVDEYSPREDLLTELTPGARAALDAAGGVATRRLLRTGNFDVSGTHFHWINDFDVQTRELPEWAVVVERLSWGRFYGVPSSFTIDGEVQTTDPAGVWALFNEHHGASRARWLQRRDLEIHEIGALNRELERARLALRRVEMRTEAGSEARRAQLERFEAVERRVEEAFALIRAEIAALNARNNRYRLVLTTADGVEKDFTLAEIVRAHTPNRLSAGGKLRVYVSRWKEFLTADPREANSEGGVFPAIFGTVAMTLIMSIAVVPFGVLAALYLREYAKAGLLVSAVRIAVNNLAGVPSIVFGVFGLGFFCYLMGGTIDQIFFQSKLPSPTFGTGGILWASLTLALLTLPVVIVATEESLAAVPGSMRDGSYACGASKWQTIRRIVLPRALPGIMTGAILAMARGAGEVAPLMLVGAVKLAPELPVDTVAPFVHPERSFMHLGFHIFDLGFQSQNSEAAKPMVFTTTLLLIAIIAALNFTAIWLRSRLYKRFRVTQF